MRSFFCRNLLSPVMNFHINRKIENYYVSLKKITKYESSC